jgi:vancomycin resistance protein VanJ
VPPQKNRSQKAYNETPFGPLTVINIHGVRTGWTVRHREVEEMLSGDVLSEQGPVILGGDFNTTDQSQTYHLVKRYLANTHDDAGCGFGFTFPARSRHLGRLSLFELLFPPLLRIDHIFYSRHFTVLKSCTASDSVGSDHLPVVAELA